MGGRGLLSLSFSLPSALCGALSGTAVLQKDDATRHRGREERKKAKRTLRLETVIIKEREIDERLRNC